MKNPIAVVVVLGFLVILAALLLEVRAQEKSSQSPDVLTADENKKLDVLAEIFRRQREERDDLVARYKVVADQLARTQKELEDFAQQALQARGLKADSGATVDLGARRVVRPAKKPEEKK